MQACLITGGAGFIGSNLAERLIREGVRVRILDNLSTGRLWNLWNLDPFVPELDFLEGDIRNSDKLMEAVAGVHVVFHQAAMVSVPRSVADPLETAQINDLGTLQVLEASRRAGVKRVVLASSCAVYGNLPRLPKDEDMPTRPLSPYAASKLQGEINARLYCDLYGLETVCLRYFNVYGPRQDSTSPYSGVISIFMDRAARDESPTVYGDGDQYRDFVYVADVVEANMLAAQREGIAGLVINVGTGTYVTINRLWQAIARITGTTRKPDREAERPGDLRESVADISRARQKLGFEPRHSFQQGLEMTWQWYRGRR
ncbi:MAG: SDR family oxidoreductase [Syntrophobacteria bacterium]